MAHTHHSFFYFIEGSLPSVNRSTLKNEKNIPEIHVPAILFYDNDIKKIKKLLTTFLPSRHKHARLS